MKEMLVSDLMTRKAVTLDPEANLLECAKKMFKEKVGALFIVDKDKRPLGCITLKEILWAMIKKPGKNIGQIKVTDVATKKLKAIGPKATLKDAIRAMQKYKRLPVIQKGKLVGLITIKDILNFKPELYPEFEEASRIKEETEKLARIKMAERRVSEGICGECGNYDLLYKSEGRLVCENCL